MYDFDVGIGAPGGSGAVGEIKVSIALREWVALAIQARTLQVSHEIAMEAYALPGPFHKDPADRILVAAARCHELIVLAADERILRYRGVRSRNARM